MIISNLAGNKHTLGKMFAKTLKSNLNQSYIKYWRRKIEDVKLIIIDAAEKGEKPPKIKDVMWLYDLQYNHPQYRFVFKEFESWLSSNGIIATWRGSKPDYYIEISVSTWVDLDNIPEDVDSDILKYIRYRDENNDE